MSSSPEIEYIISQLMKAKVSEKNINSAFKINKSLVEMLLKKNVNEDKKQTIKELFLNISKKNN
jgi:hypothetical protein